MHLLQLLHCLTSVVVPSLPFCLSVCPSVHPSYYFVCFCYFVCFYSSFLWRFSSWTFTFVLFVVSVFSVFHLSTFLWLFLRVCFPLSLFPQLFLMTFFLRIHGILYFVLILLFMVVFLHLLF